ncbi:MAG: YitT family protein [Ruminococcaceae bacterium]|nr:YitT family protein [Oscillospiraceae bacterium]
MTSISKKDNIKNTILFLIGPIITAFGISVFYLPNKIVSGGVSGISTVLYHLAKIPPGLSFAVINGLFLLISIRVIGRSFVLKTLVGAALVSLFVQIFSSFPPMTNDVILASIFGSLIYGFGIGLTFLSGGSTGGTDILGRLLQHFFPHMKIGKLLLLVDAIVIISALIAFREIDLALWGIVALFLSTFAVDFLIQKLNISKLAFVVTDKGLEVSKLLVSTSPRGVTIIDVTGAYTMEKKTTLMCALKENEIPEFQRKILEIDSEAFIIFSESQQIVGNGFHVYR